MLKRNYLQIVVNNNNNEIQTRVSFRIQSLNRIVVVISIKLFDHNVNYYCINDVERNSKTNIFKRDY